ncbi:MAG: hemolysin family protein [Anaerolineae bacterium]
MDSNLPTGLVALLILLGVNAALSSARQALVVARPTRLRQMVEEGRRGAARALALAENPTRTIASLQLAVTALHLVAAAVAVLVIAPPIVAWLEGLGVSADAAALASYAGVILLGTTATILITEMIPGALVTRDAERVACTLTVAVETPLRLLAPLSQLLLWLSSRLAGPLGAESDASAFTEEEIMTMVDAGEEVGVIDEEERVMIRSIFQFADTLVREVMVPRIDMVALEIHTPLETALDTIIQAGHSRIPVYEGSIDHIRGILYAKDLLNTFRDGLDQPLVGLIRPAYFIPEAKRAVDLLEELQKRKVHIAIVVDEYGGTAGLVTIEDLIEEIVGEIQDEYDFNEEAIFEQLSADEFIFDARIDLDDFNELSESNLATDTGDTLGGFIFSVLGRVPHEGESFHVDGLQIEVLTVTGRRIRKVRVKRLPSLLDSDARDEVAAAPD